MLRRIRKRRPKAVRRLRFVVGDVRVVLRQAARRPVGLRSVTTARAVQGGDVLERDQDVPVELYVRNVFEVAVRGQDAVLVLAAEQGDLDLLTLVLVGVILDGSEPSRFAPPRRVSALWLPVKWRGRVVQVWFEEDISISDLPASVLP
jgi:hypothetical protein